MITCPYCGLPNWESVQVIRKRLPQEKVDEKQRVRREDYDWIILCKCTNCNRIFYLFKTKLSTYTLKLEDVEMR